MYCTTANQSRMLLQICINYVTPGGTCICMAKSSRATFQLTLKITMFLKDIKTLVIGFYFRLHYISINFATLKEYFFKYLFRKHV